MKYQLFFLAVLATTHAMDNKQLSTEHVDNAIITWMEEEYARYQEKVMCHQELKKQFIAHPNDNTLRTQVQRYHQESQSKYIELFHYTYVQEYILCEEVLADAYIQLPKNETIAQWYENLACIEKMNLARKYGFDVKKLETFSNDHACDGCCCTIS